MANGFLPHLISSILFHHHHLPSLVLAICLKPIQINSAGSSLSRIVLTVPDNLMSTPCHFPLQQGFYLLALEVIDCEADLSRALQAETDSSTGIEGIGIVIQSRNSLRKILVDGGER